LIWVQVWTKVKDDTKALGKPAFTHIRSIADQNALQFMNGVSKLIGMKEIGIDELWSSEWAAGPWGANVYVLFDN
jgi:hypothetical protein